MMPLPTLASTDQDKLAWGIATENDFDTGFYKWCRSGGKGTMQEFLETCSHLRVEASLDERKAYNKVVRATCLDCGSSTVAQYDDWLSNRTRLSKNHRKWASCVVALPDPKDVCDCDPCRKRREERYSSY